MTRPTDIQRIPTPTQSLGTATLRLDFLGRWSEFADRFLRDGVRSLWTAAATDDPDRRLEESELGPDAFTLDRWFGGQEPRRPRLDFTVKSLRRLANDLDDLADDAGGWRDDWRDVLRDLAKESLGEVTDAALALVRRVAEEDGPAAARQVLHRLRGLAEAEFRRLEADRSRWTVEQSARLRAAAPMVRGMTRPRSWTARVWFHLRKDASARRWLRDGQLKDAAKAQQLAAQAAQDRYAIDLARAKRHVLEKLGARPGTPGVLDDLATEIADRERFFAEIAPPAAPALERPDDPTVIDLVPDLDTPLNPTDRTTLEHVYRAEAAKVGCTPAAFAARLRDGLEIRGRRLIPGRWAEMPLIEVRAALGVELGRYLGTEDPSRRLDTTEPTTALEAAAAISLTHPCLRWRLDENIDEWVRRAQPYAVFRPIQGVDPVHVRVLYCHSSQRVFWCEQLPELPVPPRALEPELAAANGHLDGFALANPFEAILSTFAFGLPGHAQPSFLKGIYLGHRMRRRDDAPEPMHDLDGAPELRILDEREDGQADAIALLDAAIHGRVAIPLKGTPLRFALSRPEPTVDDLFAETVVEAEWRSAAVVHEQMRKTSFKALVEMLHPEIEGWYDRSARLAEHHDPDHVAGELTRLGVLEAGEARTYRMARRPDRPEHASKHFFAVRRGRLVGLTREEFLGHLIRDDWFYNVVFWRVVDELAKGNLARTEVPESLVRYVDARLEDG